MCDKHNKNYYKKYKKYPIKRVLIAKVDLKTKQNLIYLKKILDKNINIICGHFEGVDQRILETRNIEEVSVGDFILSGGETAAFVIIDSILRLLPGVIGNEMSKKDESFMNLEVWEILWNYLGTW